MHPLLPASRVSSILWHGSPQWHAAAAADLLVEKTTSLTVYAAYRRRGMVDQEYTEDHHHRLLRILRDKEAYARKSSDSMEVKRQHTQRPDKEA